MRIWQLRLAKLDPTYTQSKSKETSVNDAVERFFVITGGPGSGKSTLIDALEHAGYARSIEAGRAIIQAQVAIDGPALPWRNPALFAELMLSWELRSYALAQQQYGPVFFDRGVPDVVGYLRLMNLPVPAHVERAAATCRYHRRVFIAPPWPEIFAQDRERKQDFAEAVRTCDAMVATYADFGYELVELPRAPVACRVDFVLEKAGVGTVLTQTHA
jgi:predicted ATPase